MRKLMDNLRTTDRVTALVLGINMVGMTLYIIFGTRQFYARMTGAGIHDLSAVVYHWASTWIFLMLPVTFAWLATGNSLKNAGFSPGDKRLGIIFSVAFIIVMAVPLYMGGHNPQMMAEYPLFKGLSLKHPGMFMAYESMYFLYYLAWEGTFRGIVFFAALRGMGATTAIIYETAITTLLHYPKPTPEIFAALAGGIVFGLVALRTRSIFWPLLCHFFVGIITDLVTLGGVIR